MKWGANMHSKKYEPRLAESQSPLVDAVLEEMKNAFQRKDVEAIDELLRFCPRINLIQYLPEEQWTKFMTPEEKEEIYADREKLSEL